MIEQEKIATLLDAAALRSAERRRFLGFAAAGGGLALLSACGSDSSGTTPTPTPTATATSTTEAVDITILNLALNLEYLSAQYFAYAATGAGLPASLTSGTGTAGTVTGGSLVPFSDPVVAACALELARDDRAHVAFIRSLVGTSAVAMQSINISTAFTAFATAAGVAGFNPYASDESFLYGAFILKDVIVTAYKGLTPLLGTASNVTGAAGILGTESYHAGLIRTLLYQKGFTANPTLFSNQRDSLDGATDLDQGIAAYVAGSNPPVVDPSLSNIAPVDGNGIAYSRTTGQVLNIFFQNKAAVTSGGFFPSGINGTVNSSAASG